MINNAQEWREFYKSAGAHATCMSIEWLRGGCPKCGRKKWQATSDCWVYCMTCNKGYSTDRPFTNFGETLTDFDFTDE